MEKLGVELPLLLTQMVNFTIMVFILSKLLYKPILKALEERRKKIEEGLAFAAKATEEEQKREEERQKILVKARSEAKQILDDAKKEALKKKDVIIAEGKEEVDALRAKLEKEMDTRQQEMVDEVSSQTVAIASEMVKRLIPELVNKSDAHKLIETQLARFEKKHEKKQ
jgi:F-type H+-transporting ATPase subunit b